MSPSLPLMDGVIAIMFHIIKSYQGNNDMAMNVAHEMHAFLHCFIHKVKILQINLITNIIQSTKRYTQQALEIRFFIKFLMDNRSNYMPFFGKRKLKYKLGFLL